MLEEVELLFEAQAAAKETLGPAMANLSDHNPIRGLCAGTNDHTSRDHRLCGLDGT